MAKENPLMAAMEKRASRYPMPPPARTFEFTREEVGDLKQGDDVTVYVFGKVRSVNDGKALVEVSRVTKNGLKDESSNTPMVTLATSPSP